MESCDCPHSTAEHAPLQDFGTSMCLVPDCDCEGTREQVIMARVKRSIRMAPTAERVYKRVLEVLGNPMQRTIDDQARNIAAVLVAEFEIVQR